jgi:hypothetical protein
MSAFLPNHQKSDKKKIKKGCDFYEKQKGH